MSSSHPNSLANLKPIPKGKSGNPKGRPRKIPDLDKLMAAVLGEKGDNGYTAMEGILKRLRAQAAAGNVKAAQLLMDRAYGKAKQQVEVIERRIVVKAPEEEDEQA